jgi:hypothetical protein
LLSHRCAALKTRKKVVRELQTKGLVWRGLQPAGVSACRDKIPKAKQVAKKLTIDVILSGAKNPSSI